MNLNRTIKLTKPIRIEIADSVKAAWMSHNPRPFMTRSPSGSELRDLDDWKTKQVLVRQQTLNALETFSSVNQLEELWPNILPFVPEYLVNPDKYFALPEAA